MNFSTVPPKRSSSAFTRAWYGESIRRTSSGSSFSARPVKPTRSAKRTLTTLRSSRMAGTASPGAIAAPQRVQKPSSSATTSAHSGQARPSCSPQLPQNSAPALLSKPQEAHSDMAGVV